MTATLTTPTVHPTVSQTRPAPRLWRVGLVAGVAASAATFAYAALVDAAGVSLEVGGEAIPRVGFAQATLVATLIGTVLAVVLSRRVQRPARTFVRLTIALTALSFVPDVLADAQTATKIALACSHIVAAVIVIPMLARRLSN